MLILSSALHGLVEHCNYRELYKAIRQNHTIVGLLDCNVSMKLQTDPELTWRKLQCWQHNTNYWLSNKKIMTYMNTLKSRVLILWNQENLEKQKGK